MHYLCSTSHSLPKLKAEQKICDNILYHTLTRKGKFPAGISEGLCLIKRWLKLLTRVYFSMDDWYWEMFPAPQLFGRRWEERGVALKRAHPSLLLPSCARMRKNIWSHLSRSSPFTFIILSLIRAFGGVAGSGLCRDGVTGCLCQHQAVAPYSWYFKDLSVHGCACTRALSRVFSSWCIQPLPSPFWVSKLAAKAATFHWLFLFVLALVCQKRSLP